MHMLARLYFCKSTRYWIRSNRRSPYTPGQNSAPALRGMQLTLATTAPAFFTTEASGAHTAFVHSCFKGDFVFSIVTIFQCSIHVLMHVKDLGATDRS